MIKLLRIDHRLIHGQVAVFWVSHAKADTIVVATDGYANDQLMRMTMSLAKPRNVELIILNTSDAITCLNNSESARKNILVVAGTTSEAVRLVEACDINEINVGAMNAEQGRKKVGLQVFINEEEMADLSKIHNLGRNVFLQAKPTDKKVMFRDILSAWEK